MNRDTLIIAVFCLGVIILGSIGLSLSLTNSNASATTTTKTTTDYFGLGCATLQQMVNENLNNQNQYNLEASNGGMGIQEGLVIILLQIMQVDGCVA